MVPQCDVCEQSGAESSVVVTGRKIARDEVTNYCDDCKKYVGMGVQQLLKASPRLVARVYPFSLRKSALR
jgi:hypothetical protein